MTREAISDGLRLVFQGIECLKDAFPNRSSRLMAAWLATSVR